MSPPSEISGNASFTSKTPSPSSSVSAVIPAPRHAASQTSGPPSPSVSVSSPSVISGNASAVSRTPSSSSSVSALLPVPSASVSTVSVESLGKASEASHTPSLSLSNVDVE